MKDVYFVNKKSVNLIKGVHLSLKWMINMLKKCFLTIWLPSKWGDLFLVMSSVSWSRAFHQFSSMNFISILLPQRTVRKNMIRSPS